MTDVEPAAAPGEPPRVRLLDDRLSNQIAAGEVVERPASVLKELMENALDAGATRIAVYAERGGTGCLRVRDDGCGIHREDLGLALTRHATSKLSAFEQLSALRTMGFRGEALPSIASVSRLTLSSRARYATHGWRVGVDGGGEAQAPAPVAEPPGTTVEVRDLFFNTPARRRFLRTERTESRHLEQVFRRLALSRMDVSMALTMNGRQVLDLSAARSAPQRQQRLARLMGRDFADAAIAVAHAVPGLAVDGWLAPAEVALPRPDRQQLFVNARSVVDTTARHAVRLAYGEALDEGDHPAWILFLTLDPAEVDVNVHPMKQEVRFHDARSVHDFLRQATARALDGAVRDRVAERPPRTPPAVAPPAPVVATPARASAPRAPVRAPASAPGLLHAGFVLFERGDVLFIACAATVQRALVDAVLDRGDSPRPLLLPERLDVDAASRAVLEAGAGHLRQMGIVLRVPDVAAPMLLAAPAGLAAIPASGLARVLVGAACRSPSGARAWRAALGDAAAGAVAATFDEALAVIDALDRTLSPQAVRPWWELGSEQLARLVQEREG